MQGDAGLPTTASPSSHLTSPGRVAEPEASFTASKSPLIDLHSHILPGLDDGPANTDFSLALARDMEEAGIEVVVATPHIRSDHVVDPLAVQEHVESFNRALRGAGVRLTVVTGGEVDISTALTLDRAELEAVCLGSSTYLLVESPHSGTGASMEEGVRELRRRGFGIVLAHPERSRMFVAEPERLERLVAQGVLSSVTAASMAGGFGRATQRFTARLFKSGLVHDVASDAHDHIFRPPGLLEGFRALEVLVPGLSAQFDWYTRISPQAIIEGREAGPPPSAPRPPSRLRKLAAPLLG